jgi:RNA polymerase sigma-70 factor, ECF subfamily
MQWYVGRDMIGAFFAMAWKTCGGLRLTSTAANGQPAFAVYERGATGRFAAHSIHVLTLERDAIATLTAFVPPTGPQLFNAFGLPLVLPDAANAESSSHHS